MARRKAVIGIVVLAVLVGGVFAAFAARGDRKAQAGSDSTPPPPPATVTHDEDEWSIVTPAGWTSKDHTKETDAEKAVRYQGPNGEYVIVAIDPLGSDYTVDTLWTYKVKGDRFEIVARKDCTGTVAQGCSSGDNRFDGYAMWKTGTTPKKVGGHVYYFMFGNTEKDSIDADVFEQILESLRVNG
jgi:hypothetical protein